MNSKILDFQCVVLLILMTQNILKYPKHRACVCMQGNIPKCWLLGRVSGLSEVSGLGKVPRGGSWHSTRCSV